MKKVTRTKSPSGSGAQSEVEAARVFEMMKASGILNPDATLDQLLNLSRDLNTTVGARGAFIFRDFLYRPC